MTARRPVTHIRRRIVSLTDILLPPSNGVKNGLRGACVAAGHCIFMREEAKLVGTCFGHDCDKYADRLKKKPDGEVAT